MLDFVVCMSGQEATGGHRERMNMNFSVGQVFYDNFVYRSNLKESDPKLTPRPEHRSVKWIKNDVHQFSSYGDLVVFCLSGDAVWSETSSVVRK